MVSSATAITLLSSMCPYSCDMPQPYMLSPERNDAALLSGMWKYRPYAYMVEGLDTVRVKAVCTRAVVMALGPVASPASKPSNAQ